MINVVGIKFRCSDKIYYFDSGEFNLKINDLVIVEVFGNFKYRTKEQRTKKMELNKKYNAIEIGLVKVPSTVIPKKIFVNNYDEDIDLRKVLRVATKADLEQDKKNREIEKEAFIVFVKKAKKYKLDMKLLDVQVSFDFNKIIFSFTSDGRVDFRNFVKDLAFIFKTRIELRQVGVRDETKFLNGVGICGRTLCCSTFLNEFQPVSIKMAKDQNIPLNSNKISGICGRLMCCLKYEQETYEELNNILPKPGDIVKTSLGIGEVISSNIFKKVIKATVRQNPDDISIVYFFNVQEVEIIKRKKIVEEDAIDKEELKEIIDE